jgi:hypothetical protein
MPTDKVYQKWISERNKIPLVNPRPCFDSDWEMDPMTFWKEHPGQLNMHSTMLKLLKIFETAGCGKKPLTFQWRTLFELDLLNLMIADGSNPDETINEKDTAQRLVRAICESYGQDKQSKDQNIRTFVPHHSSLAFIRQFALNLACSSTHPTKKQLLSYTKSLKGKIHIHRAYDAARELLGRIQLNSIGPSPSIQRGSKKNKDNSPLKIVDEKSDDNDETIEEEIPNEMTVSKENDPDYSERSTSSDDEVDIVGGEDEYEKKTTCQKSFQNYFEH